MTDHKKLANISFYTSLGLCVVASVALVVSPINVAIFAVAAQGVAVGVQLYFSRKYLKARNIQLKERMKRIDAHEKQLVQKWEQKYGPVSD